MMAFAPMDPATRNWGNETTSPGVVIDGGGASSITGSHNYMKAGSYTVTLTVTDDGSCTTHSSSGVVVDKPK